MEAEREGGWSGFSSSGDLSARVRLTRRPRGVSEPSRQPLLAPRLALLELLAQQLELLAVLLEQQTAPLVELLSHRESRSRLPRPCLVQEERGVLNEGERGPSREPERRGDNAFWALARKRRAAFSAERAASLLVSSASRSAAGAATLPLSAASSGLAQAAQQHAWAQEGASPAHTTSSGSSGVSSATRAGSAGAASAALSASAAATLRDSDVAALLSSAAAVMAASALFTSACLGSAAAALAGPAVAAPCGRVMRALRAGWMKLPAGWRAAAAEGGAVDDEGAG